MAGTPEEWLKQAEYNMDTARAMFDAGRHFYAVFMCHLSLEKALKGLYMAKTRELPARTHSLLFLLRAAEIEPPETTGKFIAKLNEANVAIRYPEELETLQKNFTETIVQELRCAAKEALAWIKDQF